MDADGHIDASKPVLGTTFTGLTVGGSYVWISDPADGEILRIPEDLSSGGSPIQLGGVATGASVVEYLSGEAIAVGFDSGTLAAIDGVSGNPIWVRVTGVRPSAMTSGDGEVWVVGVPVSSDVEG